MSKSKKSESKIKSHSIMISFS